MLPYALTQLKVIVSYIGLLLLPIRQTIYHDISFSTSPLEPAVFGAGMTLIFIIGLAYVLLHRSRGAHPEYRLIVLGIAWFFVTLSVESSVVPLPVLMCEYRAYLPSVGFFIAVVVGIWVLAAATPNEQRMRKILPVVFLGLALLLTAATVARNEIWGSPRTLWEDALKKNPGSGVISMKLGEMDLQEGRFTSAVERLQSAVAGGMNHPRVHDEIASAYSGMGKFEDAIREDRIAIKLYPGFAEAHYNIATLLAQQGRYGEAIPEYREVIALEPGSFEARNNLAGVFMQLGRYREAEAELQSILAQNPKLEDVRYNLQVVRQKLSAKSP